VNRALVNRRWRDRWPLIGLLTLLTYNTWVLWRPMNGHELILNGYLSELSASNQPHDLFFRGGDLTTAVIVGALGLRALQVWPRLSPRRRWWVVAAGGLVLFAVSTFLDSFFSMDCSPTLDHTCGLLEESGRLSLVHYAHTYTSVGAQAGIVTSMVGACVALYRSGAGRRWRWSVLLLCLAEVVPLVILLVMIALGAPGIGYPQGVTVAVASVWFAAVGIALSRSRPAAPPVAPPRKVDSCVG
jgi:hypothetical protein